MPCLIPCFICPEDKDAVEPHVANVQTDAFELYLEYSTKPSESFDISKEYSVWLSKVNYWTLGNFIPSRILIFLSF